MDEFEQARAYAQADFTERNAWFVEAFAAHFPDFAGGAVPDLGCGPGDIVLRFAEQWPGATVHGLDGSGAMLQFAAERLWGLPQLQGRVQFIEGLLPGAQLAPDVDVFELLAHVLREGESLARATPEAIERELSGEDEGSADGSESDDYNHNYDDDDDEGSDGGKGGDSDNAVGDDF